MSRNTRFLLLVALLVFMLVATTVLVSATTVGTAEEFKNAVETADEVTLTSDITLYEDIAIHRAVTINCGEYGITVASGTISLKNAVITASGAEPAVTIANGATATIGEGCVITTVGSTYVVRNDGDLTVEDGCSINGTLFANGTTVINGGTFRHSGTFRHHSTGAPLVFMNADVAVTTINGGDFAKTNFEDGVNNSGGEAPDCVIGTNDADATLHINGGTFRAYGSYGYVLHIRSVDTFSISGGLFISESTERAAVRVGNVRGYHQTDRTAVLQSFETRGGSVGLEFAEPYDWQFTLRNLTASDFADYAVHLTEDCTTVSILVDMGTISTDSAKSPICARGGVLSLQGSYYGAVPFVLAASGNPTVVVDGYVDSAEAIIELTDAYLTLSGTCNSFVDAVIVKEGNGTVFGSDAYFSNSPNGVINAQGGTVTVTGNWYEQYSKLVYVNGGTVMADGVGVYSSNEIVFDVKCGTLYIFSGDFNCSSLASAIIYNDGALAASVNITGGTFSGGQAWIRTYGAARFEISGDPQFNDNTTDAAICLQSASGLYGGSVAISGGSFTTSKVMFNCAGGALNIVDGLFTSNGGTCMFNMSDGNYVSDVTVSGGTFETTDTNTQIFSYVSANSNNNSNPDGSLTIKSGYFTSAGGTVIDFTPKGPDAFLKIEGGTFVQQGTGYVLTCRNNSRFVEGITLTDGTKVGCHITGGIFRAENGRVINAAGTKICIDKGSFTAGGSMVIRMSDNDVNSPVIINGGTFTALGDCTVIEYAPMMYDGRNEIGSDTNSVSNGTTCITRPVTINGGTFTAENGHIIQLYSVKYFAKTDIIIHGGRFSGAGESLIHVTSPSELATLTITGGTFTLLESDKGGAILSTGFYTRTDTTQDAGKDSHYHYDAPSTVHLPTKAKITITGGLFVDQRTGNNQVIDVSVGNATVSIKNAVLLTHERQAYFYLTADAETSAAVTMRAPTCLYGGATYYMWMTTPVTDTTMAPVLDDGAGVRTVTDSEGIRFTSTVSPAAVALLEAKAKALGVTVEYGTLIAPADYVAAAGAFTLAALNDYVASHADVFGGDTTRVYVNIPAIKSLEGDATTGVSFSGALIDLKTTNYTRVLAAVSYAKVGNNYYYSSYDPIVNARSMAQVAEAALKDVGEIGDYNKNGKLYAATSLYVPFDMTMGSVYSTTVQQVLQNYCGLEALTAASVKPTQFAMVYDTGAASMVTNYAQLLASALGITTVNGSATTSEILIGETGRTETATAKAKIRGEGYYVGVINGKIVLVGTSDALTYQAMLAFAEQCGSASVTLVECIVSDSDVYSLNDAKFIFEHERDGNIAIGYEWGYTHVKDGNNNNIPNQSNIRFENAAYKQEINFYAVDYPVKAIVDLCCTINGFDSSNYQNHTNVKQSVVLPDDMTSNGFKIYVGTTDSVITEMFKAELRRQYGAEAVCAYGYRIENGEIAIFAYDDTLLRRAVALFVADLAEFSDGSGGYAIPAALSFAKVETMPGYGITTAPMPDLLVDGSIYLHNNTYQYYYTGEGVDLAAFNTYCATLVSEGYSLYVQNDDVEGSYFRTYVSSDKSWMIHVIYAAFTHAEEQLIHGVPLSTMFEPSLRVVVADVDGTNVNLLPEEWVNGSKSYTKLTDTMITSVNIDADNIGNCYIITLEDGSSSNPITIAAYYLSHGHNDHFVVFNTFVQTYVKPTSYPTKLEAVIANFISDDEAYNSFDPNIAYGRNYLGTSNWYHSNGNPVPYYKVQTGQRFYVRNVEFEVLYTHGDLYPWGLQYFNNSSTVIRTTIHNSGENGSKVSRVNTEDVGTTSIWTGDVQYRGTQVMRAMYGDYLKSDTVQMAHHGGNGADAEFYQLANASIVFIPHTFDGAHGEFTGVKNYHVVNRTMLNETDWEYIILHDEYNVTITVTADGPQMAESALRNFADSSDEYSDGESGIVVEYGRYVITRDTITDILDSRYYAPVAD